jgi:osmotically-inducible protein OsmY
MRHAKISVTGEWIDDEDLQRRLVERLESDPALWIERGARESMIFVEVEEGYATLNGIVRSPMARNRADAVARGMGALGVHNRLLLEGEVDERPS